MNLYEINAALEQAYEEAVDPETGEIIENEAYKAIDGLQMALEEKTENVLLWIKNLQADAEALKKEKIGAAGLDVLEVEPMDPENPLCKLSESDRLLITPHIAWAAVEARTRLLQEVYKNLKAFQKGEKRNVCTG